MTELLPFAFLGILGASVLFGLSVALANLWFGRTEDQWWEMQREIRRRHEDDVRDREWKLTERLRRKD